MKLNKKYNIWNRHNITTFNVILWLFFFVILLFIFSDYPIQKIDIIYTISYLITLVPPVILGLYYFIPKLLKKEKNVLFVICVLVTTLFFSFLNISFHNILIDFLFPDYFFISYLKNSETVLLFITAVFLAIFVKLAEDWIYFNQKEKAALQLELSVLKNQINPHFLFNALNVLYSLSISKKEETTQAILQLSNILRYGIYETENEKIPLSKEIELIKNYIDFEKNRSVLNAKINFEHAIEKDQKIPPMLLLPLIENAFKHGIKSGIKNPFVIINLVEKNNRLSFHISNNFLEKNHTDKYSGIGIQNVKQQLEILFPNQYTLEIIQKDTDYTVILKIEL
ncbi:sensor histidine kinase [Tenacibaculum jejuense]|uniref:Putative two-component system sensor histidine kinase n=1 Tax=Tenacibaculum jejuense TaxID=584609 RepID=A0A238UEQ6_9FLAO|nr:histidine kinase [Tenacibaculum jejuense]SNR17687.1 Putative two-component system sensor histidine kinase [Tenacibaculum jejuense]